MSLLKLLLDHLKFLILVDADFGLLFLYLLLQTLLCLLQQLSLSLKLLFKSQNTLFNFSLSILDLLFECLAQRLQVEGHLEALLHLSAFLLELLVLFF